jgi:hypothetical protein
VSATFTENPQAPPPVCEAQETAVVPSAKTLPEGGVQEIEPHVPLPLGAA